MMDSHMSFVENKKATVGKALAMMSFVIKFPEELISCDRCAFL
jgi:hypothetical protein